MFGQHTKDDARKHLERAKELEYDRIFIQETIRKRREMKALYNKIKIEETRNLTQEPPSGYNWRKVMMNIILEESQPKVAYR